MARRVQTVLEDDFDGSGAVETLRFSLDGVDYEIDLSAENADRLRAALEPYTERARPAGGPPRPTPFVTELAPANETLRAWARSRGYRVPDRGRMPSEVKQAYADEQQSPG